VLVVEVAVVVLAGIMWWCEGLVCARTPTSGCSWLVDLCSFVWACSATLCLPLPVSSSYSHVYRLDYCFVLCHFSCALFCALMPSFLLPEVHLPCSQLVVAVRDVTNFVYLHLTLTTFQLFDIRRIVGGTSVECEYFISCNLTEFN